MHNGIRSTPPRPTPRALASRPGKSAVPPLTPAATTLTRLETWTAYVLRDRQQQEATA